MKELPFPREHCSWDRYKAFHTFCSKSENVFSTQANYGGAPSPLVLFDTGELICTSPRPDPNERGSYLSIGVTITTSNDIPLWMPDGSKVTKAWLDDGGQQYLLHDWVTKHVVRLDGSYRSEPNAQGHNDVQKKGSPLTAGVPRRFQFNSRAYIPGPGLPPVSHSTIRVSIPAERAGFTKDQLDHIHMIVATGQAAMKLGDHEALHRSAGSSGANPDVLLKCTTWMDVPTALLPALAKHGAGRVVRDFDYLLAEQD